MFPRFPLHNIFTDCLQYIVRRKLLVARCQCLIQTTVKFLFVAGKICKTHHKFFREESMLSGKTKHLHPKWTQTMQQRNILTDKIPRFHIKERTETTLFIKFFQHKQYFRRCRSVCTVQLKKQPQKCKTVFFLTKEILQPPNRLSFITVQTTCCTKVQINTCLLQFLSGKLSELILFQQGYRSLVITFYVCNICLIKMIFRIFTP